MPSALLTLLAVAVQMPFSMSGPHPQSMLLLRPDVQKELNLTKEQKKAIKTEMDSIGAQSNLGPMAAANADVDAKVLPLLDAAQGARLLELWIQFEGPAVLATKPMQEKFALDDTQKARTNASVAFLEKQVLDNYRKMSANPMAGRGIADHLKKMRKEMNATLLSNLTPEQLKAYEIAQGQPFKFQGGVREL